MGQIKNEFNQYIKPDPSCTHIAIRPASPPLRQYPTFPLPYLPTCLTCGRTSRNRDRVLPTNPNGNFDRPFYFCKQCVVAKQRVWITWDDYRGIYSDNPDCDCGLVSRRERAGVRSASAGSEFWKCAVGRCRYWESVYIEEQTWEDVKKIEGTAEIKIKEE